MPIESLKYDVNTATQQLNNLLDKLEQLLQNTPDNQDIICTIEGMQAFSRTLIEKAETSLTKAGAHHRSSEQCYEQDLSAVMGKW